MPPWWMVWVATWVLVAGLRDDAVERGAGAGDGDADADQEQNEVVVIVPRIRAIGPQTKQPDSPPFHAPGG